MINLLTAESDRSHEALPVTGALEPSALEAEFQAMLTDVRAAANAVNEVAAEALRPDAGPQGAC